MAFGFRRGMGLEAFKHAVKKMTIRTWAEDGRIYEAELPIERAYNVPIGNFKLEINKQWEPKPKEFGTS